MDAVPRLAFTPTELAQSVGVGRSRVFEAIRKGELEACKAGTRTTLIDIDAARRWIKTLPKRAASAEAPQGK
jgi:excisionase family DNA binding protein